MTTTTAAYLAVTNNLTRYQSMTAAEPAVKLATAYYQANIGKVNSIQAFVGNYRLLSYALNAYGLGDQIGHTALITKVLQGGVSDPKSLANTLTNGNWKAFASAFDFVGKGAASVNSASAVKTTTSDYVEQQLESDQGAQDVGVQLALYFQRVAPTVSNEYGILADKNLFEVAQTIFGLAPSTNASSLDAQANALAKTMPIADLQDPKKLQQLTERFTALYDVNYGPASGATSSLTVSSSNSASSVSAASAILAGVISSNGVSIANSLNAFTRPNGPYVFVVAHDEHPEAAARRVRMQRERPAQAQRSIVRRRCIRPGTTLRSNPLRLSRPRAAYVAACAAWSAGRREEASARLDEALRLKPDFAEAYCMGGFMLGACGKPAAALRFYERALSLDPSLVIAHKNMGKLLFAERRFAKALAAFAAAAKLAPSDADAWSSKAGALRELGRLEESLEAATRALALEPNFPEAAINRGNALLKLDRMGEALDGLSRGASNCAGVCRGALRRGARVAQSRPLRGGAPVI